MKTANESLTDCTGSVLDGQLKKDVIFAMKCYAKLKCKEQREICVGKINGIDVEQNDVDMIRWEIEHSPEPKFD